MQLSSQNTERAKPLLGTVVRVRLGGPDETGLNNAFAPCFAEMARVHELMSFQENDSDVSRLNREASRAPVQVDWRTYEVLQAAESVSRQSGGIFDVTMAPHTAAGRDRARQRAFVAPDPAARWDDVVLLPDRYVRFSRPLWIDLSGIAKGYAVDRAMRILEACDVDQACVNAGGDLAVMGPDPENVYIESADELLTAIPVIAIRDASVATSRTQGGVGSEHVEGSTRIPMPPGCVSVSASSCATADALTKVVMARGVAAHSTLRYFGAAAVMKTAGSWLHV